MHATDLRKALGGVVIGVDHLTVAVRDLEAAVRFYETVLGFEVQERRVTHGQRTSMDYVVLSSGAAMLVLVASSDSSSQVNRFIEHKGEGVSHVAFAVADLDQALERVGAAGEIALTPVEDAGIRQVFLERDEESGVRIELIERRGGRFNERSVREMYRVLEARDLY